jgi:hypothetical protein
MNIEQNITLPLSTIQAALDTVEGVGSFDYAQPTDFERELWRGIKNSIRPHLYGTMPEIVKQTYKGESESQRKYRKAVYRSKSHHMLMQSIQDIHKIAQSDDFIVDYNDTVANLLTRTIFGKERVGTNSIKNVFGTIYKDRVLDPNGYIGIEPHNHSNEMVGDKMYKLELYPSENIVAASESLLVFRIETNTYRAYTRNSTFVFDGQGYILSEPFIHNSGDLGCYILGGVPMNIETTRNDNDGNIGIISRDNTVKVVEVQMSDYSYSVDELDRLENRNSQNEVVTTLHVYPRMVARDIGCDDCDGTGQIAQLDEHNAPINQVFNKGLENEYYAGVMHTCHKCKGKGVLDIGTQDVVSIPMPTGADMLEGKAAAIQDLGNSIIAYVTPEINSAKFLYEQLNDSIANAKEMLRLQRFEDFGESGAAKRIDQEAGQPRLRAIAEGLQNLIKSILTGLVNFEYIDSIRSSIKAAALSSINVSIPSFFDLITVGESKQLYFENIDKKPLFERYLEQRKIIKKQYSSPKESRIFEIAYLYTNGANLLMQNELINYQSIGALTTEGVYIAAFIDSLIRRILFKAEEMLNAIDILQTTKEDFATLIDAELAPILAQMQAAKQSQTTAMLALNTLPFDAPIV